MIARQIGQSKKLLGKNVFLSASVPSRDRRNDFRVIPDSRVQIEEAVVSLTRAVLSEGGRLVFGGHPSISPLVGLVASEYQKPLPAEGEDRGVRPENEQHGESLILIYQSEAFREHLPDETWEIFRRGVATIRWVPAVGAEKFDPAVRNEPQCHSSLQAMRRVMLEETRPIAMICVGGMEGVIEEAEMYHEFCPGGLIYAFQTTGGAAYLLAKTQGVRVIDREISDRPDDLPPETGQPRPEIKVIPYPFICQLLVRDIAEIEREGSRGS